MCICGNMPTALPSAGPYCHTHVARQSRIYRIIMSHAVVSRPTDCVYRRVGFKFNVPHQHITGHFGDKSFQPIMHWCLTKHRKVRRRKNIKMH